MDLKEIRKLIIQAIAADDLLMDLFVLKGGNALDIVHKLNSRTSVDVDFSVDGDFSDVGDIEKRLFRALSDRFDSVGFVAFDTKFGPRPLRGSNDPRWGGYEAEFKLVSREIFNKTKGDLTEIRKVALSVGDPSSTRKFLIQISKYEWVEGAIKMELDGFEFRVYTLPMIAIEKIRAICQQMEGYPPVKTPRPRARDFLDIFAISQRQSIDYAEQDVQELVVAMFKTKEVPLKFLARVKETRDFHIQDWSSVQTTTVGTIESFDHYFNFVVTQVEKLKPLWVK